jgi:hypothetical protein
MWIDCLVELGVRGSRAHVIASDPALLRRALHHQAATSSHNLKSTPSPPMLHGQMRDMQCTKCSRTRLFSCRRVYSAHRYNHMPNFECERHCVFGSFAQVGRDWRRVNHRIIKNSIEADSEAPTSAEISTTIFDTFQRLMAYKALKFYP